MNDDCFVIIRFGQITETYHQTVCLEDDLSLAVKQVRRFPGSQVLRDFPWVYITTDGYIVENVEGPDLVGCSIEYAYDFFKTFQPVHLDETQGDAL